MGNQVDMTLCNVCDYEGKFLSYGKNPRHNALCPNCKSLERHRFLFYLLKPEILEKKKVLYVSPPASIFNFMDKKENIEFFPIDIDPNYPYIKYVSDITRLPFNDCFFDIVVCFNALKYVKNDDSALAELSRVLKKNGILYMRAPTEPITKSTKISPEEKQKRYVPGLIYRSYGLDLINKLILLGFLTDVQKSDQLDSVLIERHGLSKEDSVIIAKKQ